MLKLQISKAMFGSDSFGRLFYLSVRKNTDLNIVFLYLPCFVHPDESFCESKKSIHFLKKTIDYSSPLNVNTVIADVMFVVRSSLKEKNVVPLHHLPDTF